MPTYRKPTETLDDAPADLRVEEARGRWLDFREVYRTTPAARVDLIRNGGNAADFKKFARWLTQWMEEPVPALAGAAPSDYMDTIEGQEMIAKLLAMMRTGAYA